MKATSLRFLIGKRTEDINTPITEILLEGNFSIVWNPNRHLSNDPNMDGTLALVNCQNALLYNILTTAEDCPNALVYRKGSIQVTVTHFDSSEEKEKEKKTQPTQTRPPDKRPCKSYRTAHENTTFFFKETTYDQKQAERLKALFKKEEAQQSKQQSNHSNRGDK